MSPRRALPEAARRGWCPSLTRPMPTGDGLLARVHPPLGQLSVGQLRAVAEGARRFGNGHIDVTARANLQIRGVRAETAAGLAAALADVGLGDTRADGGPQRLTLTSPLAGLIPEPLDTLALAQAVEAAGLAVPSLPPKTLVAISGPGVAGEDADLVLHPLADGCVLTLPAGAGEGPVLPAGEAATVVARLLTAFAASGRRRIRDLPDAGHADLLRAAGRYARDRRGASAPSPLPAGRLPHDAPLVAVEAPFGRCEADALDRLADVAGDGFGVRTGPGRGFVLAGGEAALAALAAAGFVTRSDDPRRAVAACPGAPACASGTTPVPGHAARLAAAFAPFAARGLVAHVSGCAKGCARPGPADLTLVAEAGVYRAGAGQAPGSVGGGESVPRLTFEAALERVRRADPASALALAFSDP